MSGVGETSFREESRFAAVSRFLGDLALRNGDYTIYNTRIVFRVLSIACLLRKWGGPWRTACRAFAVERSQFDPWFDLYRERKEFVKVVQRVEIITGQQELRHVMAVLDSCGVTGYARLRNVLGKGDKKVESFDPITGEVENLMIVTTIDKDALKPLIEALRPILKRFGGSCLVSDAMWVIH